MELEKEINISLYTILRGKITDYVQLIKLRLSLLVVFSSSMAYLWATHRNVDATTIWLLSIGGFFITGSANILNQVIERRSDKLMKRTSKRPLPDERMRVTEALILAHVLGISGALILSTINLLTAVLGISAVVIYACLYTPLKKITRFAIVPGAVAGSLPVVIGCVAATGNLSHNAWLLFLLQFIWQFPHTWSIAWLLNKEYHNAGIKLLPAPGGKNKASAAIIMISTFLIVPAGLLLYMYESAGIHVSGMLAFTGTVLTLFACNLFLKRSDRSAIGLMLGSFAYLPVVLIILVAEKYLS